MRFKCYFLGFFTNFCCSCCLVGASCAMYWSILVRFWMSLGFLGFFVFGMGEGYVWLFYLSFLPSTS